MFDPSRNPLSNCISIVVFLYFYYGEHSNYYILTKYQKGVHCIGVKVFNMLPFYIKANSDNPKNI